MPNGKGRCPHNCKWPVLYNTNSARSTPLVWYALRTAPIIVHTAIYVVHYFA